MPHHLWSPGLQVLAYIGAAILVAMAWRRDTRHQRLPLVYVAAGLSGGLLLQIAFRQLGVDGVGGHFSSLPAALSLPQVGGATASAMGVALGLLLFVPLQWLGWSGANELRLMIALGGLLGPASISQLALMALGAGALLAAMRLVWQWHMNWVLARGVLSLARMLPGSIQTFEPAVRSPGGLPCGTRTLAAALLVQASWALA